VLGETPIKKDTWFDDFEQGVWLSKIGWVLTKQKICPESYSRV